MGRDPCVALLLQDSVDMRVEPVLHVGNWSLGRQSQGFPIRTIRGDWGLLGFFRPYWEDLAPLA